jgi:hypothetical protein
MQTIWDIQILARAHADALVVVYTFIFAFIVDQIKSVFVNALIYLVIVRRFGFLKENEKDFVNKETLKTKEEPVLPKIQASLLKSLESTLFETASLINIAAYTIFIL